jgi:hypothetical protein
MNFQIGDCVKLKDGSSAGIIVDNHIIMLIEMVNNNHPYIVRDDGLLPLFSDEVEKYFIKITEKEYLNEILKS